MLAERGAVESDLSRLAQIPRDSLSPGDRAAYDTFRWTLEDARERHSPTGGIDLAAAETRPDEWLALFFPDLSSGDGVAPYRSLADYDNGLARIAGFIAYLGLASSACARASAAGSFCRAWS